MDNCFVLVEMTNLCQLQDKFFNIKNNPAKGSSNIPYRFTNPNKVVSVCLSAYSQSEQFDVKVESLYFIFCCLYVCQLSVSVCGL